MSAKQDPVSLAGRTGIEFDTWALWIVVLHREAGVGVWRETDRQTSGEIDKD